MYNINNIHIYIYIYMYRISIYIYIYTFVHIYSYTLLNISSHTQKISGRFTVFGKKFGGSLGG